MIESKELIKEFEKLELEVSVSEATSDKLYTMTFQPELLDKIRKCQEEMREQSKESLMGDESRSQKDDKGILRFSSRIWIPNVTELKKELLQDAHNSPYSIRPESTKMYQDLKKNFRWTRNEMRNC